MRPTAPRRSAASAGRSAASSSSKRATPSFETAVGAGLHSLSSTRTSISFTSDTGRRSSSAIGCASPERLETKSRTVRVVVRRPVSRASSTFSSTWRVTRTVSSLPNESFTVSPGAANFSCERPTKPERRTRSTGPASSTVPPALGKRATSDTSCVSSGAQTRSSAAFASKLDERHPVRLAVALASSRGPGP